MALLPTINYKLRVICFTFNQAASIEKTMNGFSMQKTDFPFVAIIIDDASTDGEAEVIRNYIDSFFDIQNARIEETDDALFIVAIHKDNRNCHFYVILLKYNYYRLKKSKSPLYKGWYERIPYIAMCEGDDYWISPDKLQKQVSFLDSHPDYILCCSEAKIVTPSGEQDWRRYDKDTEIPVKDIIIGGGIFIQTCTICYRNELKTMPLCCRNCHVGDYPLQIWASLNGKIFYFADKMATYNYGVAGSWTSTLRTLPAEVLANKWRSELDMLQGLDSYSNGKYHEYFKHREIYYVYSFLIHNINEWKYCYSKFVDVIQYFSLFKKIIDRLARKGFTGIASFLVSFRKGEFKSAFVALPLVNSLYSKWKER
jgi:glycosyltransferase involved in cell wall biosynthesis